MSHLERNIEGMCIGPFILGHPLFIKKICVENKNYIDKAKTMNNTVP